MNKPSTIALPHWNLESIYPSLESPEFQEAFEALKQKISALESYMMEEQISREGSAPSSLAAIGRIIETYLGRINEILMAFNTLRSYIFGFVSTDSFNALAKRRQSEMQILGVSVETQEMRFKGWLGKVAGGKDRLEAVFKRHAVARDHSFVLRETLEQSRYLMSDAEETLASRLSLSGGSAWEKLQSTVTSQVVVPFEHEGELRQLPMSALQNLVRYDPDESVRRSAFEAEIRAWENVREPLAACLNGVKGTVNTLDERRGRPDSIHGALDKARIDRETLEAMHAVMRESFPMFRRYFLAKARRLGKERLAWWDLWAPLGHGARRFSYDQAREFILEQFGRFSERLVSFSGKAFEGGWIDAEPRNGKQAGAFCMEVPLLEESRVLVNYDGSLDQLLTLAHELGHAFHNECQAGLTMLQRTTPMTLAETASIFNETLATDAALAAAKSPAETLAILETFLVGVAQVIVDIYSRFQFEKEVFERRREAELSADDFCEIMTRWERETYGEGLDERYLHPYMWAWKPHYYSPELSYYNFPYAFGQLFGLGLYSEFQERGAPFVADYESLLRETGFGTASDLAGRFGIDLRKPDFWRSSMAIIEQRVNRYLEIQG